MRLRAQAPQPYTRVAQSVKARNMAFAREMDTCRMKVVLVPAWPASPSDKPPKDARQMVTKANVSTVFKRLSRKGFAATCTTREVTSTMLMREACSTGARTTTAITASSTLRGSTTSSSQNQ